MGHRERLSAITEKHGLPPLHGKLPLTVYISYALDLMCLAQGILTTEEIAAHQPSEDSKPRRSWWDWI